ncbi:MAG: type I methionyl aminopeptidase [Fibromonadaceae bacterium]|nr:type I methionyl aminopeptidase [Fibromonadaceae bacterium]
MSKILLKTPKEIERIRDCGALAAETLARAGEMCKPGVTTQEIDDFVREFTLKNGAIPACLGYKKFPKSVCTSVNDVVTHGIPGTYVLKDSDIINIDVTSILSGYFADTSETFFVGKPKSNAEELVATSKECLFEGIKVCDLPNARFSDIGAMISGICEEHGFSVVRDYCGHGIGRAFHEDPTVLHYRQLLPGPKIQQGMVFTIEPMINEGTWKVRTLSDGWTAVTVDGKLSAQWEHTVAITRHGVEILTLAR